MIEHVHLRGIEEHAALDVAHEGVVGERVPQAGHHFVEFASARIAFVMLHVLFQPEIERGVGIGGGDDVPARPAAADVIERREAAGDHVRRLEGRGGGGDQPEMFGRDGERRQQRQRVERGDGVAALQRFDRHVEHGEVIGHEERVELGVFQPLREAREVAQVEIGVRVGAGIAPGAGVNRRRSHECAELHLPGHVDLLFRRLASRSQQFYFCL